MIYPLCKICNESQWRLLVRIPFQELSTVYHWQYLAASRTVNLAGNQLITLHAFHSIQNLTSLNLDDNQISNLDGLSKLPSLVELSIKRNRILFFNKKALYLAASFPIIIFIAKFFILMHFESIIRLLNIS